MCPVYDRRIQDEIREVLDIQLRDNVRARILNREQDNRYRREPGAPPVRAQVDTYRLLKRKHGNHGEEWS
jgi:polyphosphate kinase